jgi:putative DNA primase/helicase
MDLYRKAAEIAETDSREKVARQARKTESEKSLKSLIALAQSDVPASPDDFDSDPWALNAPNGIVDLGTGEITPHSREAMCSKVTGVEFVPGARSELWEQCLDTWLPDPEVRDFVKRAVGYSLIGDIFEEVLLIAWGSGGNGKSKFFETIRMALGDYATHTPAETLVSSRSGGIPNDVARLKGARFVTASESEENRRLAEAKVKALTGGDMITARFMKAEWFEFKPTFTLWLWTNHKPIIGGQDDGIWRRIRLIPFDAKIPDEKRDGHLLEKLRSVLPAVLAWAIDGCLEYQKRGLGAPLGVTDATKTYQRESDVFGEFLDERCVEKPGLFATSEGLYTAYREWSKAAGEDAITKTAFGKKLTERGFSREKYGGRRGWVGISLGKLDA